MMSDHGQERTNQSFVGAIDQGTTSTRFIIFDSQGEVVASHQLEFKQFYPHPGWHEQDPVEIFDSVQQCIEGAVKSFCGKGHAVSQIRSIGLTTQRETTILWDGKTGEPLCKAIAWPDTRTQPLVRELKKRKSHADQDTADSLQQICGLPLSTYPSAVKLGWLLNNVDSVRETYEKGQLVFGTVDTWILFNLNGKEKQVHLTDVTNASRTMFLNLQSLEYDQEVFEFFDIDREKLKMPRVVPSSHPDVFGEVAAGPLGGVRITGCLGDQSAALVGQLAFSPGQAKNTYGTGCFLLSNVGHTPVFSQHGLLATVAYQFGGDAKPVYALEGSIAVAGSAVKFLQHNFGFFDSSHKISDLASTVTDSGGCVFVTAFSGLFAPYWIDDAKGTIFGITQHTEQGHIARATLEATCFQTKAILDAMEKDSGRQLTALAVDGGMSNSDLCMQTQADITGLPVDRPAMRETTSFGAAIAAGLAVGFWTDTSELKDLAREHRTLFEPQISQSAREKMYQRWDRAVQMSRGWCTEDDPA